jgi:formylglycine-generating enzyme required for sulfatase activity
MRYTQKIEWISSILLITLILSSCVLPRKSKDYYLHIIPPNGIKIADNFYYDQTETRNIDYREYMWWTKRIIGANSAEYLATIPDTNVWKAYDTCLTSKMEKYLRLPKNEDYPVVGITQKQAELYSKWRSDRVFEYILIKYGKLKMDTGQNKDSYFTIERYYNGTYHNQKPDPDFKYYPQYRLPSAIEWKKALHYADSVEQAFLQKTNSKKYKNCKTNQPKFQSDIIPCINDSFKVMPVRAVNSGCVPPRQHPVYNLRGNVSEWTTENEISVGGGWIHNRQKILVTDTFQTKTPNAWTGFRNVCEWKEYK